jgi:hypothetical protein
MNVNLFELKEGIQENKILKFKFLLNSSWKDILFYVAHRSREFFGMDWRRADEMNPRLKLSLREIMEYLKYVENTNKIYKDRVKMDGEYLSLFKDLGREASSNMVDIIDVNREILFSEDFEVWVRKLIYS